MSRQQESRRIRRAVAAKTRHDRRDSRRNLKSLAAEFDVDPEMDDDELDLEVATDQTSISEEG